MNFVRSTTLKPRLKSLIGLAALVALMAVVVVGAKGCSSSRSSDTAVKAPAGDTGNGAPQEGTRIPGGNIFLPPAEPASPPPVSAAVAPTPSMQAAPAAKTQRTESSRPFPSAKPSSAATTVAPSKPMAPPAPADPAGLATTEANKDGTRGKPGSNNATDLSSLSSRAPDGFATGAQPAPNARAFARLSELAGAVPTTAEEIWVIQKYRPSQPQPPQDDLPGSGSLVSPQPRPNGETELVPVPLKHTAVTANIAGYIASVGVKQQYANPFSSKIEAVYVFPLPENAAVNEFLMTIGDRTIRGIIRDRAEAEHIYLEARAQGHVASLMTQERPNIFTQRVANIEPGKQIDVDITYFHTVQYIDGAFEWVFPMVVAPRYNPAGTYDGVGAAPRNAPGSTGQATEVQYLKPTERSGHDIDVTVNIDAGRGVTIGKVWSDSHVIREPRAAAGLKTSTIVTLAPVDRVPNKDFVLRWQVAGSDIRTSTVTWHDKDGSDYFSLFLVPPADLAGLQRQPVEMIFVLDCSGSMSGFPIKLAVAAAERGLRRLEPGDTFQIINFSSTASQMGAAPVAASPANIDRAVKYLHSLFAQGGTEMLNGLRASLDFPHDPSRLRYVAFLTDGEIGNETQILSEIDARLGATRIFSFGVGTSTNRYLLDAMAKLGRGVVAHVAAGDNPVEIMDRFFDRISHPAMTDLKVEVVGRGAAGVEVYPRQLPDLFVGRPVIITGRVLPGGESPRIRVSGKVGSTDRELAVSVAADGQATSSALPSLWARRKIADLADYATYAQLRELPDTVRALALQYNLLSGYTAFIAVDSLSRTAGNTGTTVAVPVPVPQGVSYDTTVAGPDR